MSESVREHQRVSESVRECQRASESVGECLSEPDDLEGESGLPVALDGGLGDQSEPRVAAEGKPELLAIRRVVLQRVGDRVAQQLVARGRGTEGRMVSG